MEFSISVPRATYVSFAFTRFINQLPSEKKISIHFKETSSIEAANDVSSGEADIGILRYPQIYEEYFLSLLEDKNLKYDVLWKFTMTLLMSESHPLATLPQIEYSMLSRYTEVLHEELQVPFLSFSQMHHHNKLEHPGKKIYIYERGSQFDLLERVPGTFMWVSSIPESFLKKHGLVLKICNAPGIFKQRCYHLPSKAPHPRS